MIYYHNDQTSSGAHVYGNARNSKHIAGIKDLNNKTKQMKQMYGDIYKWWTEISNTSTSLNRYNDYYISNPNSWRNTPNYYMSVFETDPNYFYNRMANDHKRMLNALIDSRADSSKVKGLKNLNKPTMPKNIYPSNTFNVKRCITRKTLDVPNPYILKDLKQMATKLGVKGASTMKKSDLCRTLTTLKQSPKK